MPEWTELPIPMLIELDEFYKHGTWPGAFIGHLLKGEIEDALKIGRGFLILPVLFYAMTRLPRNYWGTPANVLAWQQRGGAIGRHGMRVVEGVEEGGQ